MIRTSTVPSARAHFRHGVASGDPLHDRVIIWTRVSDIDAPTVTVEWTVAMDPEMRHVVASGATETTARRDWTVHIDVVGLRPDTVYHYRFEAMRQRSPIGRTRTLADGHVDHLRFAFVSCAKYNAGFFNVYGRLAARDDIDFVLHLGDYIYEASNTPPATQTPGADIGRPFEPLHECRTIADYRARYAQYRRDPDVQAVHAAHPVIATLDDHELADGAWRGGADNHDEMRDGAWQIRRAAAQQARWEWMPARLPDPSDPTRVHRSVRVGDLVELLLLDFRSRRDRPMAGPAMHHPSRSALGIEQRAWLEESLVLSTATWRLIGTPSPMARTWRPDLDPSLHVPMRALKLMHAKHDAPDEDQWDGYPAERDDLLRIIHATGRGKTMLLAGDLHVSMAIEHEHPDHRGEHTVVEVVTPSITSQNLDEKLHLTPGTDAVGVAADLVEALDGLQWCELESHGYSVVDVDRQRINVQWWYVDTVLSPSSAERLGHTIDVAAGSPVVSPSLVPSR